ncbi:MAG: hypothetical protein Q7T55_05505 [Solirubrobacteraceae bacterium]|nr:hypothetical protein [Solirubrobacteraceae bacterium]
MTLVLTGRRTTGKAFRITFTAKPTRSGRWSIRATLPKNIRRVAGLTASVRATATRRWTSPRVVLKRIT